jgi:protein-tyrosine phosphatase
MSVDAPNPERTSLLFVCLGNICRSPLAKWIFTHQAKERGVLDRFTIDSCGTGGWHAGGPADPRSIAVALEHGLEIEHAARQIEPRVDFARFEYLLAMDRHNRDTMLTLGAPKERVILMRSFDPTLAGKREEYLDVPDPYHGGEDGFEKVYQMLWRACEGLIERV